MSIQIPRRRDWRFWVFLVGSFFLLTSLGRGLWELLGTSARFEQARQELAKLQDEKVQLESQLRAASREFTVEQTLRDRLGLARPGEKVVILPQEVVSAQGKRGEEANEEDILPNWRKWLALFW